MRIFCFLCGILILLIANKVCAQDDPLFRTRQPNELLFGAIMKGYVSIVPPETADGSPIVLTVDPTLYSIVDVVSIVTYVCGVF